MSMPSGTSTKVKLVKVNPQLKMIFWVQSHRVC